MLTLAQWILRLTKGYIKFTGKQPDKLAKLKIKLEAARKVKDQSKVIQGKFNPKEEWWKARPGETGGITSIKTGKKLDFASAKEFEEDLYSLGQNFIKNDPRFNLELAQRFKTSGTRTYAAQGEGKLHSPTQRQTILEKLKKVMKHDTYQAQFGEDLADLDLTDDLFRIDKASGGIARVGMFWGGPVAKAAWQKFVEKLFIKTSNAIRRGEGKWKGLTQEQWITKHDDLTKMLKEWEWSGKKRLPPQAKEFFGMNDMQVAKAFKEAEAKAARLGKKGPNWKEQEVQGQVDDLIKKRTEDILDEAGVTSEGVSKTKTKTRTMDDLVEDAYNEVSHHLGRSGDYKYDADVLAESIALKGGKIYDDLSDIERSGIYDLALTRVTKDLKTKMDFKKNLKDVEQKIELQMFDTKGRKPNASGGIAGQLHLNEGGRARFQTGGWDAGKEMMIKQDALRRSVPSGPFYEGQDYGQREGTAYAANMPSPGFKWVYDQAGGRHAVPNAWQPTDERKVGIPPLTTMPVEGPMLQPVGRSAPQIDPLEEPMLQQVEKPMLQPVEQPMPLPVEQPTIQPVEQPVSQYDPGLLDLFFRELSTPSEPSGMMGPSMKSPVLSVPPEQAQQIDDTSKPYVTAPQKPVTRNPLVDPRMYRSYQENIQRMGDPRMRGAKGGLAKILGV